MNCLNININAETLVDLLVERVSFWTEDKENNKTLFLINDCL